MVIVNVEGAIRKDNKWIIIERSKKEEHVGRLLFLRKCKTQKKKAAHFMCCFLFLIWCGSRQKNSGFGYYPFL